jgi:hypothetical protein
VQRALDLAALEPPVSQRSVLVRAGVVDGEDLTVLGVEDGDRRVRVNAKRLTRRQLGRRTDLEHVVASCFAVIEAY